MLTSVIGVLYDGLAYGMLLFVLSVGLSVTLGMMNFVNLAHCAFAMLGGYVTVTLINKLGWPFLATLPVSFLAAAVVSVRPERREKFWGSKLKRLCSEPPSQILFPTS